MELNSSSVSPLCIPFSIKDTDIDSDSKFIRDIRDHVMSGEIVVLKDVFEDDFINTLRNKIITWGKQNSIFPHGESPSKYPELNYHRIDDGSVPSVCPHMFHQYGFNSIDKLEEDYRFLLNIVAEKLVLIQNAIAGTSFDVSLTGMRLKVLQYPEGGGFLAEHTHPREPQRIGLILSLSKKDVDFREGAAVFKAPKGHVDTLNYHDIGDVVVFRYDLPHAVSPVNTYQKSIDWTLETGKWSVVLELRDTHALSHKKSN